MARKMVLVPEDMYRGMLSSSDTLGNTARVLEAKQAATKTLRSRKMAGVRRVLFDKKMRDFLKLRREAVDRPIKVEISQTPVATTTTEPSAMMKTFASPSKYRRRRRAQVTPVDKTTAPPEESLQQEQSPETQRALATPSRAVSAPSRTPSSTLRTARLDDSRAHIQGLMDNHAQKILNYVRDNRDRFGVTEQGGILGSKGNPVRDSDVEAAVKNILQPAAQVGVAEPTGVTYLRSRLMKDQQAANMIKRALDVTRTQLGLGQQRRRTFVPTLWTRF